jgi:hypothetical protein
VVLPLYELADYTEVWQQDANVILPAILVLFIGMALIGAKLVVYATITVLILRLRIGVRRMLRIRFAAVYSFCKLTWNPPRINLPVAFCDLRI